MNTNQMRMEVARVYPGAWKGKVERMSEAQVTAIYLKLKKEGKVQ